MNREFDIPAHIRITLLDDRRTDAEEFALKRLKKIESFRPKKPEAPVKKPCTKKHWLPHEDEFLKRELLRQKVNWKYIVSFLDRTRAACEKHRYKLDRKKT